MVHEEVFRIHERLEYHFRRCGQRLEVSSAAKVSSGMTLPRWIERSQRMAGEGGFRIANCLIDPSRLKALLLVNRQIFNEKVPVFYKVNQFHAQSVVNLEGMLRRCGPERIHYFTQISFDYITILQASAKPARPSL